MPKIYVTKIYGFAWSNIVKYVSTFFFVSWQMREKLIRSAAVLSDSTLGSCIHWCVATGACLSHTWSMLITLFITRSRWLLQWPEATMCHITSHKWPRLNLSYLVSGVSQFSGRNKYECPIRPGKGVRSSCKGWLLPLYVTVVTAGCYNWYAHPLLVINS